MWFEIHPTLELSTSVFSTVLQSKIRWSLFQLDGFLYSYRFIAMSTFVVFSFTGVRLTAEKAFLCLSMFNTVRLTMTLFFPFAISQWGETKVSIKRIQVCFGWGWMIWQSFVQHFSMLTFWPVCYFYTTFWWISLTLYFSKYFLPFSSKCICLTIS